MYGWPWPGLACLGGAWWPRGCEVGLRCRECLWRGVLVVGGFLGRLWTEMRGMRWVGTRLVYFWVMHGMVIDETQHFLTGGGVGVLLRVCQQEVFAVYHLGCCPADCS